MKKVFAIVPAAGCGSRFNDINTLLPKQYYKIFNQPLIYWTLNSLALTNNIDHIILAIRPDDNYDLSFLQPLFPNLSVVKCGGITRAQTVENAFSYICQNFSPELTDLILVHDAARCCIKAETINFLIENYKDDKFAGAILAKPITDSVKSVSYSAPDLCIRQSVARNGLYVAETPQIFKLDSLLQAIANKDTTTEYTDEASLFKNENIIQIVENIRPNPKITYISDVSFAEFLLNT